MKTQVEFRSSKFPPYPDEKEEINPGVWGRRLVEYLVPRLAERGIETEEAVLEDWGYWVPIVWQGPELALCCGHQNGDDDEFVCFTNRSSPIVRKLFKKIDISDQLAKVTSALNEILASDPDIREIVWTDQ